MVEEIFFNKILPGSIGFGMEMLYSNNNAVWNKKMLKKQQMINEKIVEASSIENVLVKNQRILEAEVKREQDLYFKIQEMDKAIEKLKAEQGETEKIQEWIKLRSYLKVDLVK